MTPEVVGKLEEAFKIGATDVEACNYANIHKDTYYSHLKSDSTFSDRMASAKEWPILAMKKVIVQSAVGGDKQSAQWYLERKKKAEFAPRQELTGAEGTPLGYAYSSDLLTKPEEPKQLSEPDATPS